MHYQNKENIMHDQKEECLFMHAWTLLVLIFVHPLWCWSFGFESAATSRNRETVHLYFPTFLVHTTSWWIDSIFCFRCWLSCYVCICQEKVIPCLLRLEQANDPGLRAAVREALALVGYHKPVKGRGIRILSIDGGGLRYTLNSTPLPPTLVFTLRYELISSL